MSELDRNDTQKLVKSYTSVLKQAEQIMEVAKGLDVERRRKLEETAFRLLDEAEQMTTFVRRVGR